jgi:hypothetical protein
MRSCRDCPRHGQWYCDVCADLAASQGIIVDRDPMGTRLRQALGLQRVPLTLAPDVAEGTLQGAVHKLCHDLGLLYYHAVKSKLSTPGLPDCLILRPDIPGPLYTWELKREGEEPKPAQRRWLDAFARATSIQTGVYYPADLPAITALLTRRSP